MFFRQPFTHTRKSAAELLQMLPHVLRIHVRLAWGLGVCVWSVCLCAWLSALQPCMEIPLHESWIHLPPGSNEGQFKRLLTSQMLLTQRTKRSEYIWDLRSSYWSKLAHECTRVLRQPAETMLCACRCSTEVSCYFFANCAKPTT